MGKDNLNKTTGYFYGIIAGESGPYSITIADDKIPPTSGHSFHLTRSTVLEIGGKERALGNIENLLVQGMFLTILSDGLMAHHITTRI